MKPSLCRGHLQELREFLIKNGAIEVGDPMYQRLFTAEAMVHDAERILQRHNHPGVVTSTQILAGATLRALGATDGAT